MTRNLGGFERKIRILLGVGFLAVWFIGSWFVGFSLKPHAENPELYWVVYTIGAVSLVALVTGAIGFCPAWKLLGINTCPTKPTGS